MNTAFPPRILVTGRILPEIESHFGQFGGNVVSIKVGLNDLRRYIEAYIQTEIEALPLDDGHSRQNLADKILAKWCGCLLRVHLVVHELLSVYTDGSLWTVLDEIPEGMVPFYRRIIETMSQSARDLNVTMLFWTVCSIRPVRTSELQQALRLDISADILDIRRAIEGLCGQLVHIDRNDTVHTVHAMARYFLIGDTTSEYAVSKHNGHEKLALNC